MQIFEQKKKNDNYQIRLAKLCHGMYKGWRRKGRDVRVGEGDDERERGNRVERHLRENGGTSQNRIRRASAGGISSSGWRVLIQTFKSIRIILVKRYEAEAEMQQ